MRAFLWRPSKMKKKAMYDLMGKVYVDASSMITDVSS